MGKVLDYNRRDGGRKRRAPSLHNMNRVKGEERKGKEGSMVPFCPIGTFKKIKASEDVGSTSIVQKKKKGTEKRKTAVSRRKEG